MDDEHDRAARARPPIRRTAGLVACVLSLALSACQPQADSRTGDAPPAERKPPPHLVELDDVVREALRTTSVYVGTLRYRRSVRIFAQESGRITRLPHYEGDAVPAGETLLALDDRLLRAELDKARATAREAEINLRRFKRLHERQLVPEDEYLRAQTALEVAQSEQRVLETRLGYTRAGAPFAGVISARLADPGDIVDRYAHVLTLVDPDSLVTDLAVSELVLPHLAPGDRVEVQIDALGDTVHAGRLLRIHPELDARTRQGRVEIEIAPVPAGARAGQFARVSLSVAALRRLMVPFAALRRDRDGEYVYRVGADAIATRVPVRSGGRMADRVEILTGLNEGEQVVVRGFLGLQDGKQVTPVSPSPDAA